MSSCSAKNELASSGNGNEILFTVEEEPLKPDSTNGGGAATRATKVTSISSFKVYAYNASGTAIADGVTYTKSGNSWVASSKVFWPQTGNVTFYAFSPASNSSVTFDTSNKQLKYTAPTAQGSQQDVLYAYTTSSRPSTNTVNLTFNHANAAFSVSAKLAEGCTATVNVSGVKLVNVMPTNTLTVSSGAASASGSNISTDVAINSTTLTTTAATISSSPLMLPPQSVTAWSGTSALANTYLAVTCKVQANDKYVVGSSSATGTVYVPMDKTLTKGQENTVNLVFGTLNDGKRSYGRDDKGNRIVVSVSIYEIGKVICTDGTVYNTVSEATAAGKTAAGMIVQDEYTDDNGAKHGMAIALKDGSNLPNVTSISTSGWDDRTGWEASITGCGGSISLDIDDEEYRKGNSDEPFAPGNLNEYLTACGGIECSGQYLSGNTVIIDTHSENDPSINPGHDDEKELAEIIDFDTNTTYYSENNSAKERLTFVFDIQ